ncbi:hypothetical protein HDU79_005528 [Rhizoclosmatium sp. JEL0117]|nr:hypothetical protein HDU79_005528 [Rhizoclosmatium sp. JEL0117]
MATIDLTSFFYGSAIMAGVTSFVYCADTISAPGFAKLPFYVSLFWNLNLTAWSFNLLGVTTSNAAIQAVGTLVGCLDTISKILLILYINARLDIVNKLTPSVKTLWWFFIASGVIFAIVSNVVFTVTYYNVSLDQMQANMIYIMTDLIVNLQDAILTTLFLLVWSDYKTSVFKKHVFALRFVVAALVFAFLSNLPTVLLVWYGLDNNWLFYFTFFNIKIVITTFCMERVVLYKKETDEAVSKELSSDDFKTTA